MKVSVIAVSLLLGASAALAQSDRGAITGVVTDPAGAIVPNAPVEGRNLDTGAAYPTSTSSTGNYALNELPAGTYELTVTVPGFKKYIRQALVLQVRQTLRIDAALEVGAASESVTVTEATPLLKTESGELSHDVTSQAMNELPVLGIGQVSASGAGIRNPLAVTLLVPGSLYIGSSFPANTNSTVRINGTPTNSQNLRIEGLDATNTLGQGAGSQTQPSVDAIEEFAIQTSNFSAEFGLAGGAVYNMTMKSGGNRFHGTMYDYFVNEALNAGIPFTNAGNGHLARPSARRNDYGFTVGGPVRIPRIYNGRDKTFFFFNWEEYIEYNRVNNLYNTVPIQAYRNGDFSAAIAAVNGRVLGTDILQRPIIQNSIYDPTTQRLANGQLVRDIFPNNLIPNSRIDPVARKIQALVPLPNQPGLVNNGLYPFDTDNKTWIPSLKLDHILNTRNKLSFYWQWTRRIADYQDGNGGYEGFPQPVTRASRTATTASTERLNYDFTITPTLLLHMGVGYQSTSLDVPPFIGNYDPATQLGLNGPFTPQEFPQFTGLTNAQGGLSSLGNQFGGTRSTREQKTTATVALTWVRNNHIYKTGGEVRIEGYPNYNVILTTGSFGFSAAETALPYLNSITVPGTGGTIGLPYASFLLGLVDSGNVAQPAAAHLGKQEWGFYVQDSWKVRRTLTVDYGLRYDYSTYERETYGRMANFSATTPNPSAGGLPGAVIYEGSGQGQCNCSFAHNYPWAFGPRLGFSFQLTPKTVVRGGAGIIYNGTDNNNLATRNVTSSNPFTSPAFGQPAMVLSEGVPLTAAQIAWPNLSPGYYPFPNSLTGPPSVVDQNAGRPARTYQWSFGIQREIVRNLVVEATYVGNRGIWWQAPTQVNYNALTPERLAKFGLDINNAADRTLLNSPLSSAAVIARGFTVPYQGFPVGSTLAQALRPFPQFSSGLVPVWAPLGNTWYDSLQVKVTRRFSQGLDAGYNFTWQKELTIGAESDSPAGVTGQVNDVFNRNQNKYISAYSRPLVSTIIATYTLPKWGRNRVLSYALSDWQLSTVLTYASGLPILSPVAQNNLSSLLFRGTYASRVPGVPLFTQDLNCHCFDPNTTFVLNPRAWTDPAPGQWGTSAAYYNDYRQQRRPQESIGAGRLFRLGEKLTLSIRAEFSNVFNRTEVANPVSTNALATQTRNSAGQATAGFGWINTTSLAGQSRQGTVIARFRF